MAIEALKTKALKAQSVGKNFIRIQLNLALKPIILQCLTHLDSKSAQKRAFLMIQDTPPVDPVKLAMGWLHTARFLTTAAQLHHLPSYNLPEVAFVGRSNAGKSTCINTMTQQKRLAFASKTPGRTQHINLFALGRQAQTDAVLADLPGYGYAAVPKQDKIRWQQVMANYLMSRPNLKGIVLLCDPRHGITELDDILLDIIRPRVEEGLKFLVLLTKADKLNKSEGAKALSIAKLQAGGGEVMLFSALKKQGLDAVALKLWDWTHGPGSEVNLAEASDSVIDSDKNVES